jgi:hypothetical protein
VWIPINQTGSRREYTSSCKHKFKKIINLIKNRNTVWIPINHNGFTPPAKHNIYCISEQKPVLRIRNLLGLPDRDLDQLVFVRDPDPSLCKQKINKKLDFYSFVTSKELCKCTTSIKQKLRNIFVSFGLLFI